MKTESKLTLLIVCMLFMFLSNISALTWTQRADVANMPRQAAVGFSIDSTGYIGTGQDISLISRVDFWAWDQFTDTWTQKADFGGAARAFACGFSCNHKGYILCGMCQTADTNDVWEYTPSTNTWISRMPYPGAGRENMVGFSIGTRAYVGTGGSLLNPNANDWWAFDPGTNSWASKASVPGVGRTAAVAFNIDSVGYLGTGWGTARLADFYEYNPTTNTWTPKAAFPGTARYMAVGFSIGMKGYIATGDDGSIKQPDCWEYTLANTWSQSATLDHGRASAVGFGMATKGYVGIGFDNFPTMSVYQDFWELGNTAGIDDGPMKNESIKAFPNPFTEYISVSYTLEKSAAVKIEMFDLTGKSVCVLSDKLNQYPGEYSVKWNANESNLNNGMYILTIKAGQKVYTRKINLLK